ncbi:MAG: hypothetical protein LUE29_12255 [Lachnospiraceae bacterium]|nr:hypothetical protein [Lachnospiraceae bacterium]
MADQRKRKKETKKVVSINKHRVNPGVIVFGVVFLYLVVYVISYLTRGTTNYYEVVKGSNAEQANITYTGIAIRDEEVISAESAGYVNYYVQEGDRVSVNSTLYSIDENGYVSALLSSGELEGEALTSDDYSSIRKALSSFSVSYDRTNYSAVYDFKYDLDSILLDAVSANLLASIYDTLEASGQSNSFQIVKAPETGIVVHSTDGYESLTTDDICADLFDMEGYTVNRTSSNDLVSSGEEIGKIIQDERWKLVIPLSQEEAEKLSSYSTLTVQFVSDGIQAKCDFEILEQSDGIYGILTFYRFMVRYASERYLEIQIEESIVEGLKIPKTSVVDLDLYLIPVDYYVQGGDGEDYGFYLEVYDEEGNASISFITPTVYYKTDEYCYVAKDLITDGDVIVLSDSNTRYQVGATGIVQGVYQINSGYTIFKRIEILDETSDYYIVAEGISGGIVVYDHIVLDGSTVDESQIVYQ